MIRFLVLGSILLVVVCGGLRELLNALDKPRIEEIKLSASNASLHLFHQGRLERNAVLFHSHPDTPRNRPVPLIRLYYGDQAPAGATLLGDVHWTRDATSLFATARHDPSQVLWLLDLHTGEFLPGTNSGGDVPEPALRRLIDLKQGPGAMMTSWYQLGTADLPPLYSWEAEHWERLSANVR